MSKRVTCCMCGKSLATEPEGADIHTCYDLLKVCPDLDPITREKLLKLRDDREKAVVRSRKK